MCRVACKLYSKVIKEVCRFLMVTSSLLMAVWTCTDLLNAASQLNFVYLTFSDDSLIGVVIFNPSDLDADLTFTAYGAAGNLVQAQGLQNPVQFEVKAGQQFGSITSSIFGQGGDAETIAWFQVTSPVDGLTGFFIFLSNDFTQLDGADLPVPSRELVLTEVNLNSDFSTEVTVVNPNDFDVSGTLTLFGGEPPVDAELALPGLKPEDPRLPARSVWRFDVAELFGVEGPVSSSFLTLKAEGELIAFAFVESGDLLALNATPLVQLLDTLYFPQMAVLGPFVTELVLVNNGDRAVIVTMTAFGEDGAPFGAGDLQQNPVAQGLEAGEVSRFDLAELFGFTGKDLKEGWLRVESTERTLTGSLSYALTALGARAAVASAAQGTRRAIFSHLATTAEFFTGVAALNPGSMAANLRIIAIQADGTVLGSFATTLAPGVKFSELMGGEIIEEAAGQSGGAVIVESDVSVFLTSIFGSQLTLALANIPPQDFQTPLTLVGEPLRLSPPLAVVGPLASQQFQLVGAGQVQSWNVNGVRAGSAVLGTINDSGLYTAPAALPESALTVTADVGSSSVGASVDVITTSDLISNRGIVQSVAYLSGLNRLYTAELSAGLEPANALRISPAGSDDSTIFDVTGEPVNQVETFSAEDIPKIIEYQAGDGNDYLLMAAKTSGSILRLEPLGSDVQQVATGFDSPSAIVLDPLTGDLLVAESGQVSIVPAPQLNRGLGATAFSTDDPMRLRGRALAPGIIAAGLAVSVCTGDSYFSDAIRGVIIRIRRADLIQTIVVSGLLNPGQLLAIYRDGFPCPDGFQLLVVERGRDQITLVIPSLGTAQKWVDAPGALDVAALPPDSSVGNQGVAIAQAPPAQDGGVALVATKLYEEGPVNQPESPESPETGTRTYTRPVRSPPGSAGEAARV